MKSLKIISLVAIIIAVFCLTVFISVFMPKTLSSNLASRTDMTSSVKKVSGTEKTNQVVFANTTITVDVAENPAEHERGLSGRKDLPEGKGLLFVFKQADKYGFWMKDMNFPIDIIWLDKDFKVVTITRNALPETYPKTFYPTEPVLYVLEVPAGFTLSHNILIGDRATFSVK